MKQDCASCSKGRLHFREYLLFLSIFIAIQVVVFCFAWIGYLGADDGVYVLNARNRVLDPFLIGQNHWDVRLALTLPMAVAFSMLGESEFSAALPTMMYTAGTSVGVFLFIAGRVDRVSAFVVASLLVSAPLLAVNATAIRIDAVETFFVVASLAFCFVGIMRAVSVRMLVFSGIMAGLAFVTRPTTVALLAFYGLLFIVGYRIQRRHYLWIILGFGAVWVIESIYYFIGTGNFFHRLGVDFNHDQVVRSGSLIYSVFVEPVKMLFTSHNLGFVFWFLPLAFWGLRKESEASTEVKTLASFLTWFSVVWIVTFSAFASKLVLDPRYLTPATVSALVVVSLWIGALYKQKRSYVATLIVVCMLGNHMLAIYMENKEFSYAERWLVSLAKRFSEPIYTDPQTSERARFLLEIEGIRSRVVPEPAPPGALFLSVPENAARGAYNRYRWNAEKFAPGDWAQIETLKPERRGIGIVLESLGLRDVFPQRTWQKLNYPNPPITLFRRQ